MLFDEFCYETCMFVRDVVVKERETGAFWNCVLISPRFFGDERQKRDPPKSFAENDGLRRHAVKEIQNSTYRDCKHKEIFGRAAENCMK